MKVGEGFEIFTDANQAFNVDEAIRRARQYEALDIGWMEEPLDPRSPGHIAVTKPITVADEIGFRCIASTK